MKTIDIDESAELTLRCKAKRSFDLAINLNRVLTGKSYKLQVIDGQTVLLTFQPGEGLLADDDSVILTKTAVQMDLPTGTYRYDLVEIDGDKAENIFYGWFIIQPSYTTL